MGQCLFMLSFPSFTTGADYRGLNLRFCPDIKRYYINFELSQNPQYGKTFVTISVLLQINFISDIGVFKPKALFTIFIHF
jgi:hypothetical protein